MNYDLAMMALEGLARSPITIRVANDEVIIEGASAGLKDLARLFLLLGGEGATADDGFELQPGVHSTKGSAALRLKRT